MPTNDQLETRIEVLERQDTIYKLAITSLEKADSSTASAVERLTATINDPKIGLIVELDRFRAEVVADRQAFRAWVRGATFVVSIVFALFTVTAPWIRAVIELVLGAKVTP